MSRIRVLFLKGVFIVLLGFLLLSVKIHVKRGKHHIAERKSTESIFLKLKHYIDKNTKKLKVYIPDDFKHELNDEVIKNAVNYGHGRIISDVNQDGTTISTYVTDVSGDCVFYNRIKNDSSILVDNLKDSNIVYIPFMIVTLRSHAKFETLLMNLTVWLEENQHLFKDKLLLLIFSHIEHLLYQSLNYELKNRFKSITANLYLFTIEEYVNKNFFYKYKHFLMPYQTTAKFKLNSGQIEYNAKINDNRLVDVLFSGNRRKANPYRQFIFDNIHVQTNVSFDRFKWKLKAKRNKLVTVIYNLGFDEHKKWLLQTTDETKINTAIELNEWKRNSKLCLEPYGDTATRKSFWDSIMNGCIPVVFTHYTLPFSNHIDYSQFVITLDIDEKKLQNGIITGFNSLFRSYLNNKQWMKRASEYINDIRQFVQYSWTYDESFSSIDPNFKYDVYGMILAKLAEHL